VDCQSNAEPSEKDHDLPGTRTRTLGVAVSIPNHDDIRFCNTSSITLTAYVDDITVILDCSQNIEDVRRILKMRPEPN
jgi:hypothetical protein